MEKDDDDDDSVSSFRQIPSPCIPPTLDIPSLLSIWNTFPSVNHFFASLFHFSSSLNIFRVSAPDHRPPTTIHCEDVAKAKTLQPIHSHCAHLPTKANVFLRTQMPCLRHTFAASPNKRSNLLQRRKSRYFFTCHLPTSPSPFAKRKRERKKKTKTALETPHPFATLSFPSLSSSPPSSSPRLPDIPSQSIFFFKKICSTRKWSEPYFSVSPPPEFFFFLNPSSHLKSSEPDPPTVFHDSATHPSPEKTQPNSPASPLPSFLRAHRAGWTWTGGLQRGVARRGVVDRSVGLFLIFFATRGGGGVAVA